MHHAGVRDRVLTGVPAMALMENFSSLASPGQTTVSQARNDGSSGHIGQSPRQLIRQAMPQMLAQGQLDCASKASGFDTGAASKDMISRAQSHLPIYLPTGLMVLEVDVQGLLSIRPPTPPIRAATSQFGSTDGPAADGDSEVH